MKKFNCNVCNKVISDRSNYNRHLKSKAHKIKAGLDVTNLQSVGRPKGIKNKTAKPVICHKCSHCNYSTKNTGNYNSHIKKHTETDVVHKFKCTICDKTILNNANKFSHINGRKHRQMKMVLVKKLREQLTLELYDMKNSYELNDKQKKKVIADVNEQVTNHFKIIHGNFTVKRKVRKI